MLSVKAVVAVIETGQSWVDEDRFILEKPEIEITVKFKHIKSKPILNMRISNITHIIHF